jgi:putative transcriptional regulator
MRFADMLREVREKAGLSQSALAERAGLPVRSIQNWEQGHRTPRALAVLTLAKALGVGPGQLLLALAEQWLGKAEEAEAGKVGPKPGGRKKGK